MLLTDYQGAQYIAHLKLIYRLISREVQSTIILSNYIIFVTVYSDI